MYLIRALTNVLGQSGHWCPSPIFAGGVRDILYLVYTSSVKGGRFACCLRSNARTITEFRTVSLGVYTRSSRWKAALSTAGVEGSTSMTAIDLDQVEAEELLTTH